VIIPRKVGAPDNPELAIGAVAEDGTAILDSQLISYMGVSKEYVREETERQKQEIHRRLRLYRQDAGYPDVKGLDVIVADGSFSRSGLGEALINRLREASSIKIAV
jgi:predicted phosphoribosyltransferase